jgi:transposase InsO family protein
MTWESEAVPPPGGAGTTLCSDLDGFSYTAFIIDAYSRFIVGWRIAIPGGPFLALTPWRWPSGPSAPLGFAAI